MGAHLVLRKLGEGLKLAHVVLKSVTRCVDPFDRPAFTWVLFLGAILDPALQPDNSTPAMSQDVLAHPFLVAASTEWAGVDRELSLDAGLKPRVPDQFRE
jgi:hypothetical protein